jgi:thiamine biosynthesis lipoprotein
MASKEIARIENLMTDFKPSPFQSINQKAGLAPVTVNHELFSLIKKSISFSQKTNGRFDISYASIGHLIRYKKYADIPNAKKWIDYRLIELDEVNQTVFLPSPQMKIGLGGIGKGYAVDCAFHLLRNLGMDNFYVNGSGDIRVSSHHDAPRKWRFGIQNPFGPPNSCAGFVFINQGGLATSGSYKNFQKIGNQTIHHILQSDGTNKNSFASVTIQGAETLICDIFATACMNMDLAEALDFLDREKLTAILIDLQGQVHLTKSGMRGLENFAKNQQEQLYG